MTGKLSPVKILIVTACFGITALAFILLFNQLPVEGTSLALDWNRLWHGIHDWQAHAGYTPDFLNPPWTALMAIPLGWLPMRVGWALLAFMTTAVLVASVPRRGRFYVLSVLLLTLSFPSLRHAADGNFEGLVIGGTVLIVYAFRKQSPYLLAAGILLAGSKPQEVMLMIAALGLYMLLTFPRPILYKCIAAVLVIVVPLMLLFGGNWLNAMFAISERGSIMDVSFASALTRTELLPSGLITVLWLLFLLANLVIIWLTRSQLSREKAGMLITASLLLSPYAAGNSVLTIMAVGIIPLFQARPWMGGLLIVLIDLAFLWNRDLQAYYTTALFLLAWGMLAWRVMKAQDITVRAASLASAASG